VLNILRHYIQIAANISAMKINSVIIEQALFDIHQYLDAQQIWHCLMYGTLLGAVRDHAIIEWDHDFDLMIKAENYFDVLAMNPELIEKGYHFQPTMMSGNALAYNPYNITHFWNSAIGIFFKGNKIGDLYIFFPFEDGVLRRFDFNTHVYWCPHSSFPTWFSEQLTTQQINGQHYPAFRDAEKFLVGVYGENWHIPYRAQIQGGLAKPDTSIHGDLYVPKLKDEIRWCETQGWEKSVYKNSFKWPRPILGAGPIGPTERTLNNSRALWWRDIDELIDFF